MICGASGAGKNSLINAGRDVLKCFGWTACCCLQVKVGLLARTVTLPFRVLRTEAADCFERIVLAPTVLVQFIGVVCCCADTRCQVEVGILPGA